LFLAICDSNSDDESLSTSQVRGQPRQPSRSFKALRPEAFKSPGPAGGLRVEQAVTTPLIVDVPAFEISGLGKADVVEEKTGTLIY
jgi:hypothetical protein